MDIGNVPGMTHYGACVNYISWGMMEFHIEHIFVYHLYKWLTEEKTVDDLHWFDMAKARAYVGLETYP